MQRFTRIYFIIAIVALKHFILAINWDHVKPMFLVMKQQMDAAKSFTDRIDKNIDFKNTTTIETLEEMPQDDLKAMDRIFGGDVAQPLCFPYQVGLLLQRPRGLYWCGGSLISDVFVLTAAHCVDMAKRALVFLGANEIKNAKEIGQVRLMVNRTNFIIFPTWNPRKLKDDIALIKLPVPVGFNDRIHPIALPKRSYEYRDFEDKLAIASGWGRYATGVHAISGFLRFVKLRIVDGITCKLNFPLSYRSTNICTSGKHAKSTCNGDSGGPLVLQRKRSKQRVLVGITSFGSIFGCDRGYPAAFTKVASYLDWISDEAGVEPSDATLFYKDFVQQHISYDKLQCIEHNAEAEEEDEDEDEENVDENEEASNYENQYKVDDADEPPKIYHEHTQEYPDGTLLRTSYYVYNNT